MQTVQQWIEANDLQCAIKTVPENPHMHDMPAGSRHWIAIFTRLNIYGAETDIKPLVVYYSTGPGLTSFPNPLYDHHDKLVAVNQTKRIKRPSGAEILACVADDIRLMAEHTDAIEMAVSLGQTIESTTDIDRAREIWNLILSYRIGIIRLVGDDALGDLLCETEEL